MSNKGMSNKGRRLSLLWLQSGGCGGCSMSLLGAESMDLLSAFEYLGVDFLWHPSLTCRGGDDLVSLFERILNGEQHLDFLCVEGAVMRGPNGSGRYHMLAGTGRSMMEWINRLGPFARYVIAVGSCAAYGGISSGGGNPAEACGLQYTGRDAGGLFGASFVSRESLPVINVAGCPIHPQWLLDALSQMVLGTFGANDMDSLGRPRAYTDYLVHHGCPRNEYYEYKASASHHSELGCLMEELGCVGTQAHADCNIRLWNGEGSCVRGGYACINCTAPGFEEPGRVFTETPKVAGIPVGLPTDMPKAWFVALSALSKAATPKRLRENANADHIVTPPSLANQQKGRDRK